MSGIADVLLFKFREGMGGGIRLAAFRGNTRCACVRAWPARVVERRGMNKPCLFPRLFTVVACPPAKCFFAGGLKMLEPLRRGVASLCDLRPFRELKFSWTLRSQRAY